MIPFSSFLHIDSSDFFPITQTMPKAAVHLRRNMIS